MQHRRQRPILTLATMDGQTVPCLADRPQIAQVAHQTIHLPLSRAAFRRTIAQRFMLSSRMLRLTCSQDKSAELRPRSRHRLRSLPPVAAICNHLTQSSMQPTAIFPQTLLANSEAEESTLASNEEETTAKATVI